MDMLQTVIIAAITGTVQTVATVAVLKNDIGWLKDQVRGMADWLVRVENKADNALLRSKQ